MDDNGNTGLPTRVVFLEQLLEFNYYKIFWQMAKEKHSHALSLALPANYAEKKRAGRLMNVGGRPVWPVAYFDKK